MCAIADEGVDLRIGDGIIQAGVVGAGDAVSHAASRGAASALELRPGSDPWRRCGREFRPDGLTTASGTIVRRARLEQAVADRRGRGGDPCADSSVRVRPNCLVRGYAFIENLRTGFSQFTTVVARNMRLVTA